MTVTAAYGAAIGCLLCEGTSTVLQKIGADREQASRNFDLTLLLRLLGNLPYLSGILLSIFGYGLCLAALQVLPLFVVQSLIAASVIVTALGESILLHVRINRQTLLALGAVIAGLILLGLGAVSGRSIIAHPLVRTAIGFIPIPIGIIGLSLVHIKRKRLSAICLAALGGLAFGNTSTIGRIMTYPHPLWKLLETPLFYGLIASAVLGQYLFTTALQRTSATKSNAMMIAMQTLGPTLCGFLLLNDHIKAGFQTIVLIGCALVIVGAASTAVVESPAATI